MNFHLSSFHKSTYYQSASYWWRGQMFLLDYNILNLSNLLTRRDCVFVLKGIVCIFGCKGVWKVDVKLLTCLQSPVVEFLASSERRVLYSEYFWQAAGVTALNLLLQKTSVQTVTCLKHKSIVRPCCHLALFFVSHISLGCGCCHCLFAGWFRRTWKQTKIFF